MDELITPLVLPETEQNVPAADNDGAGSNTDEVVTVKELMKTVTGKDFPDDETAIKSLQDTYKWGTANAQKVKNLEKQLQEASTNDSPALQKQFDDLAATVRDNNFYQAHPEFNTPQIKALITDMGGNPDVVIAKDSFKVAAAAITKTSEMDQSQSILHSNPRLGVVQDSMTKAKEAQQGGNQAGAVSSAMDAVLGAYPGSV